VYCFFVTSSEFIWYRNKATWFRSPACMNTSVDMRTRSISGVPGVGGAMMRAIYGGRLGGSRPRFRWTEAYRLARIRRSIIRLEERPAARQLFSRRCDDFYRQVVGRHAVPEVRAPDSHVVHEDLWQAFMEVGFSADERKVYQDSTSKPQVRAFKPC
jgi:hypothetical protein